MKYLLPLEIRGAQANPEIILGLRVPTVDASKYPVLFRALQGREDAQHLRVKEDGGFENWQQIFRRPFAYRIDGSDFGDKAEKALERMLLDLEHSSVHGVPSREVTSNGTWSYPIGQMGGVRHYLGRDLEPLDEISLRPLRMPVLLLMRGEYDLSNDVCHHGEWLCETSLYVKAKEA